jgi:bifunctional non-homologous end joining protein LigD
MARRKHVKSRFIAEAYYLSPRFDDGESPFAKTLEQGYEGVVAKRRSSVYRCGERTSVWSRRSIGGAASS